MEESNLTQTFIDLSSIHNELDSLLLELQCSNPLLIKYENIPVITGKIVNIIYTKPLVTLKLKKSKDSYFRIMASNLLLDLKLSLVLHFLTKLKPQSS